MSRIGAIERKLALPGRVIARSMAARVLVAWALAALLGSLPAVSPPAHGQATSPGSGATVEPASPRVGHIRRNAQGVIELAPAPGAAPQGAAPRAAPAQPPQGLPASRFRAEPASPQAPAAPAAAAALPDARCDAGVLLCLSVAFDRASAPDRMPLTFGHPLAPKLLQPAQRVVARVDGQVLPVQLDQIARHADGSVRFAVFSLVLPRPAAAGPVRLELVGDQEARPAEPSPFSAPEGNLEIAFETYAPQISEVEIGNRAGGPSGIPFKLGETVTIEIGANPPERFALTITQEMAGGGFDHYLRIMRAFLPLISRSKTYLAHRDTAEAWETFWVTTRDAKGGAFPVRVIYGGAAKVTIREVQKAEPTRRYTASLAAAGGTKRAEPWLDGKVARETFRALSVLGAEDGRAHPYLRVMVGVRQYAGINDARYDVTVENASALAAGIRELRYDVAVNLAGRTAFKAAALRHYANSRWHRTVWSGEAPDATVVHDRARLLDSRAIPAFDPAQRVSAAAIARQVDWLAKGDGGPLGTALITRNMPMTGQRPDIGPLPAWSAMHAISLDRRLYRIVLANGDASGAVPIHYRDDATGLPINAARLPTAHISKDGLSVDGRPIARGWSLSPFSIDTAHQPSLAYYPYLLTGERYYLEEVHFWASWNALSKPPEYRGAAEALLYFDQVRGQAWALRTLGHAALITPDGHPLKALFNEQLKTNLAWYNKTYGGFVPTEPGRLPGWLEGLTEGNMAPWQHDYMMIVLAGLAENDVPGAAQFLRWMTRFGLGRFMADDKGFCRAYAVAYFPRFIDPATGGRVQTWRAFARANWPDPGNCAVAPWADPYPDCPSCYSSTARAALATLIDAGYKEAWEPYDFLRNASPNRNVRFDEDPTFAIVPRAARP